MKAWAVKIGPVLGGRACVSPPYFLQRCCSIHATRAKWSESETCRLNNFAKIERERGEREGRESDRRGKETERQRERERDKQTERKGEERERGREGGRERERGGGGLRETETERERER